MMQKITIKPLTAAAFAPFGDVISAAGAPDKMINAGNCGRYHDRARLDIADGRAGVSLFQARLQSLPYTLNMIERHPLGAQTFIPMSLDPFLVIVADDALHPQAFITAPGEAINFHRGTWHGVLTPLAGPGLFAVIDRIGPGDNLEEHHFADPYLIIS